MVGVASGRPPPNSPRRQHPEPLQRGRFGESLVQRDELRSLERWRSGPGNRGGELEGDPAGELERVHRLARARRLVTDDDVERFRENRRSTIDDTETRDRVLARIDRQPRADSFPSIQGLHIDQLGYIWVTEYSPPWEERGTTALFAAAGSWLGTLEMPREFRPLEIGEDYLLGVLTDELDVQHLVLYDLER